PRDGGGTYPGEASARPGGREAPAEGRAGAGRDLWSRPGLIEMVRYGEGTRLRQCKPGGVAPERRPAYSFPAGGSDAYVSNSRPWVRMNRNSAAVRPKVLKLTQASVDISRQTASFATARAKKKALI